MKDKPLSYDAQSAMVTEWLSVLSFINEQGVGDRPYIHHCVLECENRLDIDPFGIILI